MNGVPSLDKVAFVLSFSLLVFLYGIATQAFGWFPSTLVQQAWNQAERLSPLSTEALTGKSWLSRRVHFRSGTRPVEPEAMATGLTLVSTRWKEYGWKPGLKLLGNDGDVLHEWIVDPDSIFSDLDPGEARHDPGRQFVHGVRLFDDGDVLVNVEYVGAARLDACGRVVWKLTEGNHHSVAPAEGGGSWTAGISQRAKLSSPDHPDGFPGIDEPVDQDLLLHISGNGRVLQRLNVLDILYSNGLERYLFKYGQLGSKDVTHLNDVEPLHSSKADEYPQFEAGDLLVSLKHLDLVLVVDPDTRVVKWHESDPFHRQHDPDFIGDGWIGVFDNNTDGTRRGRVLGGSRIVAIHPETDSVEVRFPAEESNQFYTENMGGWQRLDNGNMLLTESQAGRVLEVTAAGRTVWEWVAPPYDSTRVPEVTDATRYDLEPQEVSAWPCSPGDSGKSTSAGLR